MGRNLSFDVLAADKASAALEAVAREITQLDEKIDRAGGEIEIDADTAKAQEKLRAIDSQLARLNAKSLRIDAETDQAERQLQILRAELERTTDGDKRVKVEADIAQAQAKLRQLGAEKVSIDVDTGAAQAKIAAIKAALDGLPNRKNTNVDVDAAGAFGKLAQLGTALRAVQTPVTIVVGFGAVMEALAWVQRLGGGLAALGAAGAVAGGITKAAFTGISDAVTELGTKSEDTGAKVSSSGSSMRSAIRGVEQAQRDLRDANENVERSEETLQEAQVEAYDAVKKLDDARKDATRTLEDYALRSADMGLRQEAADLSVARAQERLNELGKDGKATALDRAEAELALKEALQRQNETTVDAKRLAEDKQVADQKGVEGSDQVVAAQDRIAQANKRVEEAQRGIEKAHEQVELAAQRVADAQAAVREASQSAGSAGAAAADKQREAFEKLTPEGQKFATFLRDLLDGPLKDLQDTSQSGVLPGLQAGIAGFMSELGDANTRVQAIAGRVGDFFEQVGPAAGRAADAVLRLADIGSEASFDDLATNVENILDRFTDWANSQSPADIAADIKEIGETVKDLWTTSNQIIRGLRALWEGLKMQLGGLRLWDVFTDGADNVERVYTTFRNFAESIPGLKGKLPDLSAGFDQLEGAEVRTDGTTRSLETSSRNLATSQRDLESATRAAKDEMLRGEEANIRYEAALNRAQDSVKRNGEAWSTGTAKGRDNRQALLDLIRASDDYVQSLQRQGADVQTVQQRYQEQRSQLIQVATQMGMTKAQAQAYIDKLLQVPTTRKTTVTVDTSQAEANLQSLQNRLASLSGALSVNQNTGKQGQGAGVLKTRSTGGWVDGPGPRGIDSVPLLAAPDEFVVRSGQSTKWGSLLELINAGASPEQLAAPALQVGSPLARPSAPAAVPSQGGGGVTLQVVIQNAVIGNEDAVVRSVSTALQEGIRRGLIPSTLFAAP